MRMASNNEQISASTSGSFLGPTATYIMCGAVVGKKNTLATKKRRKPQGNNHSRYPSKTSLLVTQRFRVSLQRTLFLLCRTQRQADSFCTNSSWVLHVPRWMYEEISIQSLDATKSPHRLMKKHLDTLWKNNYGSFFFCFNLAVYQHLLIGATQLMSGKGQKTPFLGAKDHQRSRGQPDEQASGLVRLQETLCSNLRCTTIWVLHCRMVLSTRSSSDHQQCQEGGSVSQRNARDHSSCL